MSGGLISLMHYVLNLIPSTMAEEIAFLNLKVFPAFILGIAIAIVGRWISNVHFRHNYLGPLGLLGSCLIGWHLAMEFGESWYQEIKWWWVVSGAIGGICVSIGFVLAWKLSRVVFAITVTTLAGLLGGCTLLIVQHYMPSDSSFIPSPSLLLTPQMYIVWQAILLLGIGIAVQIDSAKSSAEQ